MKSIVIGLISNTLQLWEQNHQLNKRLICPPWSIISKPFKKLLNFKEETAAPRAQRKGEKGDGGERSVYLTHVKKSLNPSLVHRHFPNGFCMQLDHLFSHVHMPDQRLLISPFQRWRTRAVEMLLFEIKYTWVPDKHQMKWICLHTIISINGIVKAVLGMTSLLVERSLGSDLRQHWRMKCRCFVKLLIFKWNLQRMEHLYLRFWII